MPAIPLKLLICRDLMQCQALDVYMWLCFLFGAEVSEYQLQACLVKVVS